MGVRLRLYGCERLRRERLIGETVVGFASVNLDIVAPMWLILEQRNDANVSIIVSNPDVVLTLYNQFTGLARYDLKNFPLATFFITSFFPIFIYQLSVRLFKKILERLHPKMTPLISRLETFISRYVKLCDGLIIAGRNKSFVQCLIGNSSSVEEQDREHRAMLP
jgi:hypothetical protein